MSYASKMVRKGLVHTGGLTDGEILIFDDQLGVDTSAAPTFAANVTGDLTGNVTGNVTGDVTGNVTGDLTGNVTGNITGDVTGDLTGDVAADKVGDTVGTGPYLDLSTSEIVATSVGTLQTPFAIDAVVGTSVNIMEWRVNHVALASMDETGVIDCVGYSVAGTPGLASFNGAVTNLTVVKGIVTAAS